MWGHGGRAPRRCSGGASEGDGGSDVGGSTATESDAESTDAATQTAQDESSDPGELRPSDLDFAPTDAWNDQHPSVEVPDTPGTAIFTLAGDRLELEGDCTGGAIPEETYQEILENDEWRSDTSYFAVDAEFEFGERGADYPDKLSIRLDQSFVVASGTNLAWM